MPDTTKLSLAAKPNQPALSLHEIVLAHFQAPNAFLSEGDENQQYKDRLAAVAEAVERTNSVLGEGNSVTLVAARSDLITLTVEIAVDDMSGASAVTSAFEGVLKGVFMNPSVKGYGQMRIKENIRPIAPEEVTPMSSNDLVIK